MSSSVLLQSAADVDALLQDLVSRIPHDDDGAAVRDEASSSPQRESQLIAQLRAELRRVVTDAKSHEFAAHVSQRHAQLLHVQLLEAAARRDVYAAAWAESVEWMATSHRLRAAHFERKRLLQVESEMQTEPDNAAQIAIAAAADRIALLERALYNDQTAVLEAALNTNDEWRSRCRSLQLELVQLRLDHEVLQRQLAVTNACWSEHRALKLTRCLNVACGVDYAVNSVAAESQTIEWGPPTTSSAASGELSTAQLKQKLREAEMRIDVLQRRAIETSAERTRKMEEAAVAFEAEIRRLQLSQHVDAADAKAAVEASQHEARCAMVEAAEAKARAEAVNRLVQEKDALLSDMAATLKTSEAARKELADRVATAETDLAAARRQVFESTEKIGGLEYLVKTRDRIATSVVHNRMVEELADERKQIEESDRVLRRVVAALHQRGFNGGNSSASTVAAGSSSNTGFLLRRAQRVLELVEQST